MKILVLSFYYYPDLSAGSFRCTSLVNEIKNEMPGVELEIITTVPNRYASFNPDALIVEEYSKIKIHRIQLPKHQSGMRDQAQAFIYYAKKAMQLTKQNEYDLVFATSSRLMTAALGAVIAKKKKIPLYLDIRDLFVDTLCNVLPRRKSFLAKPFFLLLEKWTFKQATKINLVSLGFKAYFEKLYPKKELCFFTNGIDDEFLIADKELKSKQNKNELLRVLYAGNIGEGQGLHLIIPLLAKQLEGRVFFRVLGDGGKKEKLKAAIEKHRCSNVELLSPVNRTILMQEYQNADVLFLHLNNLDAFKKVLPSKLFEYAALGKPIWAGVEGYSAEFIRNEISNAAVFKPGDSIDAEKALSELTFETQKRGDFIEKYKRKNIMEAMSRDIKSLLFVDKNFTR